MARRFEVGDSVMAKWPGSSLYYEGIVKSYDNSEYLIRFNDSDESEYSVKYSHVRVKDSMVKKRRSPSRSRKSRSPARRTKSASRSSPARKPSKSPARASTQSPRSKAEETLVNNNITPVRLTRSRVKETLGSNDVKLEYDAALEEARRLLDLKTVNAPPPRSAVQWLAHTTVALLTLAGLVCVPLLLLQACTKKQCSLTKWPPLAKDPLKYWDVRALGGVASLMTATAALSLLPLRQRTLSNGATHRANGIVTLILVAAALAGLRYTDTFALKSLSGLLKPLLVLHTVLGLLAGVALYIKAGYTPASSPNTHLSNTLLLDLVEGRDTAPRLGSFDVKVFLYQYSALCSLVLHAMLIDVAGPLKMVEENIPFVVISAMQILWHLDMLLFEPSFTSGGDYRSRGCGVAFVVGSLVMPFVSLLYPRQVYNHGAALEPLHLAATSALFLAGYTVHRLASNQRHAFHTQPHLPSVAKLESIPTAAGKLAVAGWYGAVRHPVASGAALMLAGLALTAGVEQPLAPLLLLGGLASVAHGVWRSEARAAHTHGVAWGAYAARVRSALVPRLL